METIHLENEAPGLDFEHALARAKTEAAVRKEDPMLLAWYDNASGRFSPNVTCCEGENTPVCYARNRGADLQVEVEDGKYVFYFR